MKGIIGAISGDMIGSTRGWNSIKTKDFQLFQDRSCFTDDSIMTLAVANWLMKDKTSESVLINELKFWGNTYPNAGYGGRFIRWLFDNDSKPYGSWANGSAMRVSPCSWVAETLEENQKLSYMSAVVTHNHPEGIKGALATADAIYLAKVGSSKEDIKNHIENEYGYNLSNSLDEIRPNYSFDVSCAGSVPESIICFLEGKNFEDTVRNAVSLGGDADTQAAISGSIASAYWDVPYEICYETESRLDDGLLDILTEFQETFI